MTRRVDLMAAEGVVFRTSAHVGSRHPRQPDPRRAQRGGSRGGLHQAEGPSHPGPRCPGRPLRHGLPDPEQQTGGRRRDSRRAGHARHGPRRRRHRRWRHGIRLRRDLHPPGGTLGDSDRDPAEAARGPDDGDALAHPRGATHAQHVELPGRGVRARLVGALQGVPEG